MTFFDKFKSIQLIAAHRGYRSKRPENTLSAFHASLGHCHFIELDVQMSKDYVPVVIHDPTLERTSNARSLRQYLGMKSLRVSDWTLLQLKTLDIGSWFLAADPFATIADGKIAPEEILGNLPQKIMTLEEVLFHPTLQKMPINIEIKDHKGKKQHSLVAETVVDAVKKSGSIDRVLISSFNHDYLVIAKSFAPKISLGVLQDHYHPPDIIEYIRSIGASAYHPSDTIVDAQLIRQLRAAGIGVNVYTVNSKARQKELFAMGATAVFTDFPEIS
ncbi:MAG: glycerophosphodiester phosphodiesterase family protein [Pseudomonadota bacterium]